MLHREQAPGRAFKRRIGYGEAKAQEIRAIRIVPDFAAEKIGSGNRAEMSFVYENAGHLFRGQAGKPS